MGVDKGYDSAEFVTGCRQLGVTPHVAQNQAGRRSAIDGRTTRHPGYAISQRARKRVEEIFGWHQKRRQSEENSSPRNRKGGLIFTFTSAGYNLVRIRNLTAAVSP